MGLTSLITANFAHVHNGLARTIKSWFGDGQNQPSLYILKDFMFNGNRHFIQMTEKYESILYLLFQYYLLALCSQQEGLQNSCIRNTKMLSGVNLATSSTAHWILFTMSNMYEQYANGLKQRERPQTKPDFFQIQHTQLPWHIT
ncbi:hypothetical protein ACJX0J_032414 [Zea mays]